MFYFYFKISQIYEVYIFADASFSKRTYFYDFTYFSFVFYQLKSKRLYEINRVLRLVCFKKFVSRVVKTDIIEKGQKYLSEIHWSFKGGKSPYLPHFGYVHVHPFLHKPYNILSLLRLWYILNLGGFIFEIRYFLWLVPYDLLQSTLNFTVLQFPF